MNEHKITADIYGVMLELKNEYNSNLNLRTVSLKTYMDNEIFKATEKAIEWLADDERERIESLD